MSRIEAPWTDSQVQVLNAFQANGPHPYTCENQGDARHLAWRAMSDYPHGVKLEATRTGWVCPVCDYDQNWAYAALMWPPIEDGEG